MSNNNEKLVSQFYSSNVPKKQKGNNAVLSGNIFNARVMPQKFGVSDGQSMFAAARKTYTQKSGGGQGYHDSSSYIALKRTNAIGNTIRTAKSNDGIPNYPSTCNNSNSNGCLAYKSNRGNRVSVKSATNRIRSSGCVAPAKKGLNSKFKSWGGCC